MIGGGRGNLYENNITIDVVFLKHITIPDDGNVLIVE